MDPRWSIFSRCEKPTSCKTGSLCLAPLPIGTCLPCALVTLIFRHLSQLESIQVLQQGSIFLNTSLTEAFGIAILEAACAGLHVVSTHVGGVPEILPEDMISFAAPTADGTPNLLKNTSLLSDLYLDVFRAMSEAIAHIARGEHDPHSAHQRIRGFYDWTRVAERTETVYRDVLATPPYPLWTRIQRCAPISHPEQNSGIDARQDHELGPICRPHLHDNTNCRLFVLRVPRMVDA